MAYILTESGTSDGWGRPLAAFTDIRILKKYMFDIFYDHFEGVDEIRIVGSEYNESHMTYDIRLEGFDAEEDVTCVIDFNVFEVGEIDLISSKENKKSLF